jgi:hypothetical protein
MRLLAVGVLAFLAVGCGGGDERPADPAPPPAAGAPARSGPLTVAQALASSTGEPILVEGALLLDGSVARLCSGFAESHPPQCMEPSLVLEGLVFAAVEGLLRREGDVRWSDEPFRVIGIVEGRTLTVVSTAQ